jgi:CheY-like chemotaxis protein
MSSNMLAFSAFSQGESVLRSRNPMAYRPLASDGLEFVGPVQECRWPRSAIPAVLVVGSYCDGDMYAEYLQSVGFEVLYGRTPEQALPLLGRRRPAVVITDMVFENSVYDGPAFINAIRSRPDCAMTNVIVISGFVRPTDRQRARLAGADLFLMKPCAPDALCRHVNRAVWAHERNERADWNWPEE